MAKKGAKKNFYAVRVGRKPGIYRTWAECENQTANYPRSQFKGFRTEAEAQDFLQQVAWPVNVTC